MTILGLHDRLCYGILTSFALLPFGTLGLFWFFEYTDRETKKCGAVLALLLPVAFAVLLYGLFT